MPSAPRVFGVRHLSPGAARHLRDYLDEHRPEAVLVEGPVDFTPLIPEIVAEGVVPPIALLAYTRDLPVRTIVYPFAVYSPEYQALRWAVENGVEARFVDLPSGCMIGLQEGGDHEGAAEGVEPDEDAVDGDTLDDVCPDALEGDTGGDVESADDDAAEGACEGEDDASSEEDVDGLDGSDTERGGTDEGEGEGEDEADDDPPPSRPDIHDALARESGMPDFETYWEQTFEHRRERDGYRLAARAFGDGLRGLEGEHAGLDFAENLARESHVRREILRCTNELGIVPERVVVVVGALHASAVERLDDPLDDVQLAALPTRPTDLTLMPYTYHRLASQSGYGAGNRAPAYFGLMWEHLTENGGLDGLATDYLARAVRLQREAGAASSTAEVIEGVRLARALASFRDAAQPTLHDLHDAATTLLGHGRRGAVADTLVRLDIGERVGTLPDGARQTSIQSDFAAQLERLKLARFRSPVADTLKLDLRENRRVRSEEAAFLDLHRSFFLHRLAVLGIGFGRIERAGGGDDWNERWTLRWEPEREVELVEAVLLGDTVEQATGVRFAERLGACTTVDEAAALVRTACLCGLPGMMDRARLALQAMAAGSSDFVALGGAVSRLGGTLRYGDVRKLDLAPLEPLLVDLYRQGCIRHAGACAVDDEGARKVAGAMGDLHATGDEHHALLDEAPWLDSLADVAGRDDPNAFLSGFSAALFARARTRSTKTCSPRSSRSDCPPGCRPISGPDGSRGWRRANRQGLLSRLGVWSHLAGYVRDLPDDEFPRALVFLRRALGAFTPAEKRHVADNLGALWQRQGAALANALETPLSEDEQGALDDLADMDFGDL